MTHATAVAPDAFDAAVASRVNRGVITLERTTVPATVTSAAVSPRRCGDVVTSSAAPSRSGVKAIGRPGTAPARTTAPPGS